MKQKIYHLSINMPRGGEAGEKWQVDMRRKTALQLRKTEMFAFTFCKIKNKKKHHQSSWGSKHISMNSITV